MRIVFGPGRHPTSGAVVLPFQGPDRIIYEYSTGVRTIEEDAIYRPRHFPFESASFCQWARDPRSRNFAPDSRPWQANRSIEEVEMSPHDDVPLAARALARHGLAHAYGHVSARVDQRRFVVTPPCPLGHVRSVHELMDVAIDEALPATCLPEVRIHQEIYRLRPDAGGICRFQSISVIALSALRRTPRTLHGLGAYFHEPVPLWDDPALVRDGARARRVAEKIGRHRAVVLRGNGAVTLGATTREAACHAFFLEDAARVELSVLAASELVTEYTTEQAASRSGSDASLYGRMWDFLLGDDTPETENLVAGG